MNAMSARSGLAARRGAWWGGLTPVAVAEAGGPVTAVLR